MAAVVKSFCFDSGAMGLADAGSSAFITFAYEGSDGVSAGGCAGTTGCVKFTMTLGALQTEQAYNPSTGETWETWGVTPGSTVTAIEVTSWAKKDTTFPGGGDTNTAMRVVDSSVANVCGSNLLNNTSNDATWTTHGPEGSVAVLAGSQPSTTDVRLWIQVGVTAPTMDRRIDSIDLTITFTPPAAAGRRKGTTYQY